MSVGASRGFNRGHSCRAPVGAYWRKPHGRYFAGPATAHGTRIVRSEGWGNVRIFTGSQHPRSRPPPHFTRAAFFLVLGQMTPLSLTDDQLHTVMKACAPLDPSKRAVLIERVAAQLRQLA